MARFEIQQSSNPAIRQTAVDPVFGAGLVGQCCQIAQLDAVIDPRIPVSQGMRTSDLVKSMVGL